MGFAFQYEIVPAKCNSEENGDKSSKNGSSIEGEEGTFINDVKHVFFNRSLSILSIYFVSMSVRKGG